MKRILFFLFVFVILVVGGLGQEEAAEEAATEPAVYDYTDYTNYQNPDFYSNSEPSRWDWSQIDWGKMDFERSDLYSLPKFYQNLPAERYSDLNYRLVPDFNLIEDHNLIDGTKYLQDFGCAGCSVSFEQISFDEPLLAILPKDALIYYAGGIIQHLRTGERAVVPLLPPGVSLYITDSRLIVRCAAETISFCMPESAQAGEFAISTNGQTLDYQGNTINGVAEFNNGYLYASGWAPLVINDVEIAIDERSQDPTLYFDGLDHSVESPHYISFNQEEGIIRIGTSDYSTGPELRFLRHNGIFTMLGGENLVIASNAATDMLIQSRREEGLIPLVTIESTEPEYTINIKNGENLIFIDSGRVDAYPQSGESGGSVSFTLIARDAQGNPILGSAGQEERMIFDRNNNFIIVSEAVPEEELECYLCAVDFQENTFLYSSATQQITERFGIDFEDETGDPVAVLQLAQVLEELTPAARESISSITLVPGEDACGPQTSGCAGRRTRNIVISTSSISATGHHEAAHTLTFLIFEEDWSEAAGIGGEIADLVQTYGSLENAPESAQQRVAERLAIRRSTLEAEWGRVAGGEDFYSDVEDHLGPRTVGTLAFLFGNSAEWNDGSGEPRFGCFTPYACNNIYEDIAESAEAVQVNPLLVRELVNPTSEFYTSQMGNPIGDTGLILTPELAEEWAQRYRGRVELLYANEFIIEEDYRAVMSEPEGWESTGPLAGVTEEGGEQE